MFVTQNSQWSRRCLSWTQMRKCLTPLSGIRKAFQGRILAGPWSTRGQREKWWSIQRLLDKEIWEESIFSQELKHHYYLNGFFGLLFWHLESCKSFSINQIFSPCIFGFKYKAVDRLFPLATFSCNDHCFLNLKIVTWSDSPPWLPLRPSAYFVFATLFFHGGRCKYHLSTSVIYLSCPKQITAQMKK